MGLIHVGANDGHEYLGAAIPTARPLEAQLLLIEPMAEPFERLRENFAGCPNVVLVRAACGAELREAPIYVGPNGQEMSSLIEPGPQTHVGVETVEVLPLDSIVGDWGQEFTELVIDVQGYELEVLKGAANTLEWVERIEAEIHPQSYWPGAATKDEIDELLAGRFVFCGWDWRDRVDPGAWWVRRG